MAVNLEQMVSVLGAASQRRPWMTARAIGRRLATPASADAVQRRLLAYLTRCGERGLEPRVRYSSLPSRRTLEVLWGHTAKVGQRSLQGVAKSDVADAVLGDVHAADRADVFVSHSHRDYEAVVRLAQVLVGAGIAPWLAETHIALGQSINERIIDALQNTQNFLLYLSPNAMRSKWTGKECMRALARQRAVLVVANGACRQTRALLCGDALCDHSGAHEFLEHVRAHRGRGVTIFEHGDDAASWQDLGLEIAAAIGRSGGGA